MIAREKEVHKNILGLIRYYRFRLLGKNIDLENERTKKNQLNLSYLLNLLENDACNENDVLQRAAKVDEKRISVVEFGETPGLMGMVGKELVRLSPDSKISWIKLL